jgi:hypothetical protein
MTGTATSTTPSGLLSIADPTATQLNALLDLAPDQRKSRYSTIRALSRQPARSSATAGRDRAVCFQCS